eukprot:scaffold131811_cov42-Phaeocystis_antarctica.AAC.1
MSRCDGRAGTRHLHGRTARGARCATMKVPLESAGALARSMFLRSQTWALGGRPDQPAGALGIP